MMTERPVMRKTIVTCDLCKQEIGGGNQTWNVLLYAECGRKPKPDFSDSPKLSLEICRPCLDKLGITVNYKLQEELREAAPTIEDMIRTIVAEAISE